MFYPDDFQRLDAASELVDRWIRRHWHAPRRFQ
jgi:hypothetical protein